MKEEKEKPLKRGRKKKTAHTLVYRSVGLPEDFVEETPPGKLGERVREAIEYKSKEQT